MYKYVPSYTYIRMYRHGWDTYCMYINVVLLQDNVIPDVLLQSSEVRPLHITGCITPNKMDVQASCLIPQHVGIYIAVKQTYTYSNRCSSARHITCILFYFFVRSTNTVH